MTGQTSPSSSFSAEVRAQLGRQRKSPSDLAAQIGISRATLHRRLTDDSPWPLDDAVIACQYLEVSLRSMLEVSA
jgi:DNA-binding Xre family transcriptional regulator